MTATEQGETTTWRDAIPADDWDRYTTAGYGQGQELGVRPALLVIDVTRGFAGYPGQSFAESVAQFRNSCGPAAWRAIPVISQVIDAARSRDESVIYTRGRAALRSTELGRWATKNRRAEEDLGHGSAIHEIVDEVAPRDGELVVEKAKPSAFFGTPLMSHLVELQVDSLIVVGCTTSGCVRATVVDAFSLNLPVTVVEDGVFDRVWISHAVSLFDMHGKYAQVLPSEQVLRSAS